MEQTQVLDVVNKVPSSSSFANDVWFWIALAEFLLILAFIYKMLKKENYLKSEFKKKVMTEGNIDFSNTMMSAFHSKELYDKLKVKCHPDRFTQDPKLNSIATTLFQQIVENKNNYNKLLELKEQSETLLNLTY